MANLNSNNMIKFKGFYVKDKFVEEIKSALDENVPCTVHPIIKEARNIPLRPLEDVCEMLLLLRDEEAENFFDLEDKNEVEIIELAGIRKVFINHARLLVDRMMSACGEFEKSSIFAEICQHNLVFKNMILNEQYGCSVLFKTMILKNIEFLNDNGFAQSFLLLCDFCPEFIGDDLYPIINKDAKTYYHSISLLNPFFTNLKAKHIEKWNKFFAKN